jgi:hypothetical protein
MSKILEWAVKISLYCVWLIFSQAMNIITSPRSMVTKESLNNRGLHTKDKVNEENAQYLKEVFVGT